MSDDSVAAGDFVEGLDEGTEGEVTVKVTKLAGTLLGAVWLTFVGGWISIMNAFADVHVEILNAMAGYYEGIILAFGLGGAETLRTSWGAAFRAATETSPLFAPILMSLEIILVSALLIEARRRWW